jgi:SAM-dependent methyltransferase
VDDAAELDRLLAEGEAAPVDGWDFSWFAGRATEQRPSWGYARTVLPPRVAAAGRLLDVQTGGGEVLAEVLTRAGQRPGLVAATEGWPPNVAVAGRHLRPLGASVVEVADDADLPFASGSFDLVTSRHPTRVRWPEIARVLRRGGTYLAQHVGAGSVRELTDFMMGPQPVGRSRDPEHVATRAEAAGLRVVDLRSEALRTEFYDIAAVVAFLRKVVWIVPGFTVAGYRDRLAALHAHIRAEGAFVAHSRRFLIEAYRSE